MVRRESVSVILTPAERDVLFDAINFAFDSACDLPFMLQHAADSKCDRDDARDLVRRLQVAVRLLDQLGWDQTGDRDGYVVEVGADVDEFAAQIERDALLGLKDGRRGLLEDGDEVRAAARRMIDNDLGALQAARVVRTAFQLGRVLEDAS
jgi:hypothetical protein